MLIIHAIGLGLVGITVTMHAFGSTHWMDHLHRRYAGKDGQWRRGARAWCLISTGAVLTLLHVLEAFVWALALLALPETPNLDTLEKAFYFSLVTFTTLGYGDITLDPTWRLLSGIEAVNGILLAGWSTALLLTVVQRSWQLSHPKKGQK